MATIRAVTMVLLLAFHEIIRFEEEVVNTAVGLFVDIHFTENSNGIEYICGWLDSHPDICTKVIK